MKRNPNATCGNCPFWHQNPKSTCGKCQAVSWTFIEKLDTEWCGQHPDFWAEVAQAETPCTKPTVEQLQDIAQLLNGGEDAEALKELRQLHGLIDRFVCTNCGDISSSTGPGFACRECGGHLTARVVVAQPTPEPPALLDEIERLRNDRNNKLDRLRAAAGHAERLRARVDGLEAEKKTWKNALEELTPGGSEFVDDPKRCADFVRAKIETMWKVIASKNRRVAELEAERDEQNAVLREATQKLTELNVENAVLKEKLRTAEDFNENYTVIDDIGPLPKCVHCAHQQSMAFRGPDAPCYQCGIDKGYPKFKEMEK